MNDTLKTIHNLRSIHGNFSERDITDRDLKSIIGACVRAANASARQSYSVIVVNDRQVIKEQFTYNGSKALLFCVDYNRIITAAKYLGKEFNLSSIISFITGSTDTILAAQTAAIAAKSIGIDSLFTNSIHRRDINSLCQTFELPKSYCFPLIALILGYVDTELPYFKGRITGRGVVHYGKYQNLDNNDLNDLVAIYDDTQKHIGLIDDWREKGYSHYLDWFYTSWSRNESVEKQEEILLALKKAGFINNNMGEELKND